MSLVGCWVCLKINLKVRLRVKQVVWAAMRCLGSRVAAPSCPKVPAEVVWASDQDVSWPPPIGGMLTISNYIPQLENVAGERNVWAILLNLLPS